jgi:hypothetical protein
MMKNIHNKFNNKNVMVQSQQHPLPGNNPMKQNFGKTGHQTSHLQQRKSPFMQTSLNMGNEGPNDGEFDPI